MLGWIERVVPQPPVPHLTEETPLASGHNQQLAKGPMGQARGPGDAADSKQTMVEKKVGFVIPEDPGSVFESVGSSVLSWLSQGLEKVMPQAVPALAPAPEMLQSLGKSFESGTDVSDQTEVQVVEEEEEDVLEITPFDQEDELDDCEREAVSNMGKEKWGGTWVLGWMVQGFERMLPQPEVLKNPQPEPEEENCEGTVGGTKVFKTQEKAKNSTSADQSISGTVNLAAAEEPPEPVAAVIPRSLAVDGSRMFAWLIQGLEKVMPQPVTKEKQDAQGAAAAASSPMGERGKGA